MDLRESFFEPNSGTGLENSNLINHEGNSFKNEGQKEKEDLYKKIDFFVQKATDAFLAEISAENPEKRFKETQIWKAASAIGRARVLFSGKSGMEIAQEDPELFESYDRLMGAIKYAVTELPADDPAAIISKWRLEKPLEPVLPKLEGDELVEANKPSGKFIPKPEEFKKILAEKSEKHAKTYEAVIDLAQKIDAFAKNPENKIKNARVLLVGGSVRDIRSGFIPKDFDIEIYGLEPEQVAEIAKTVPNCYRVDEVGAAFKVRKMWIDLGEDEKGEKIHVDIDLAVPRVDSQLGAHQDVKCKSDPKMPIREACRRRDFTINSMAADILTGELFDFFGGDDDLENGVLKVTDERLFCDDALRVMRGLQFTGRQALGIDSRTAEIMRLMVFELDEVEEERFRDEWSKLLLKSPMPSIALIRGMEIGFFDEIHPEFKRLRETRQPAEWHPEGNAWIHTLLVVDEAAKIIKREGLEGDEAIAIMLGALCHDLGKPATTVENTDGKIVSAGHEAAGVPIAMNFLEKIGIGESVRKKVLKIIKNHMAPAQLYAANIATGGEVSDAAIRKLAGRLGDDATIWDLVLLAEADNLGRGNESENEIITAYLQMDGFAAGPWLLARAQALNVEKAKPRPMLRGDLILKFGFKPGPAIGKIIKLADSLRDEKGFNRQKVMVEIYRSVAQNGVDEPQSTVSYLEELIKR